VATGTDTGNAAVELLQMMTGYWVSQGVYVAAKLGIADYLATGPVHYEDLARKTNTHALSLYRTLRALASVGVFAEINPGQFALTPMAVHLQSDVPNSMRALSIMYCEEQYRAWGDLLQTVRTGEPAFNRQFGMDVFEYFCQNREAGAVFNEAMTNWTTQASAAVAASYDFSRVGLIVDVGGKQGTLIATILRQYPAARGILFDRPHVVRTAKDCLAKAGVDDRCTIVGGDFFASVPSGGDAYLLSYVLHDWDDERCVAILARCRQSMPANGKLLVIEMVLSEGNEPSFGKWLDLHMLVMSSGRERTAEQYRMLLQAGGFDLTRVISTPAGSSIVEARPV
jgi:O-methyltransferase domain/Dimerisation domain